MSEEKGVDGNLTVYHVDCFWFLNIVWILLLIKNSFVSFVNQTRRKERAKSAIFTTKLANFIPLSPEPGSKLSTE